AQFRRNRCDEAPGLPLSVFGCCGCFVVGGGAAAQLLDLGLGLVSPLGVEAACSTDRTGLVSVVGVFGQGRLQQVDAATGPARLRLLGLSQSGQSRLELTGDTFDFGGFRQAEPENSVE